MPRQGMLPPPRLHPGVAVTALLATGFLLAASGCRKPAADSSSAAAPPETAPGTVLFEGWPRPLAALVLTGEQHGYLEPCGCTKGQTGGLTRRADLVRRISRDQNWPTVGFDIGGALLDERAARPQELLKYKTTRAALRRMGYDAMGWGPEELRLGADQLFTVFSEEQGAGETSPQFVCANVTLFEERSDQYALETPEQFRIVTVGDVRIGVTAVVSRNMWSKVFAQGLDVNQTLFGFEEPATALARVLPLLRAERPDVMLLLAHGNKSDSIALAGDFPDFDVVVSAGGPEDGTREPETVGQTLVLSVGQKGKTAGVIGIYPADAMPRLRFQLVELTGARFAHSPEIHQLLEEYVATLDAQHPALQEVIGEHSRGSEFVGAETCGECHKKAFAIWQKTKHAQAYHSLEVGRPDDENYIVRTRDPECLCCHTAGWEPQSVLRFSSGFVDAASTPHLAGQQCENCHGPGSRHVELERDWLRTRGAPGEELVAARRELQMQQALALKNVCVKCHDNDNSPEFASDAKPFDTWWWPKVEHRGKD